MRRTIAGRLARLRCRDFPSTLHKSPFHLLLCLFVCLFFPSVSLTLPPASLRAFCGASCEIYFQRNTRWQNVLLVPLVWGGIYSLLRRVMYTLTLFYALTLVLLTYSTWASHPLRTWIPGSDALLRRLERNLIGYLALTFSRLRFWCISESFFFCFFSRQMCLQPWCGCVKTPKSRV